MARSNDAAAPMLQEIVGIEELVRVREHSGPARRVAQLRPVGVVRG